MSLYSAAQNRAKAENLPNNPTIFQTFMDWVGGETAAGVSVDPDKALSLSTFFMGKTLISEALGQLPFAPHIKSVVNGRKNTKKHKQHPSYRLVARRPHPLISSFNFIKTMQGWACMHDVAYAAIERDGNAQPVSMFPLHPDRVSPKIKSDGRYVYVVDGKEELEFMSVFKILGNTDNGLSPKSRIAIGKEGIGKAIAAQKFGAEFFSKGINVNGFIQHPGRLKDEEAIERLKKSFAQANAKNHGTGLLEEGAEWKPNERNPEDAQLTETEKVDARTAANYLNMPVTMLNQLERGTYNNIEQLTIQFVNHTLIPWARNWEEECWFKLLSEREKKRDDIQFKFNFSGLLRGDMEARAQFYDVLAKVGAYSPNHILEKEDENGYDGGDLHIVSPGAQTVENLNQEPTEEDDEESI